LEPISSVLSARQTAQRLYCMLRELEPDRTMILYHHSGQIDMAFLSWCDVYVDGENYVSRLSKTEQDYHRVYPPDAFLAQSMGHNFGPATWFLDQFTRSQAVTAEDWKTLGTQPCDHLYGLILLHDSTYWKAYGIGYERIDSALCKYSYDDRYRMIPYWSQQLVQLPENVFATFYVDDKAQTTLIVLLNNGEEDRSLRLDLDWNVPAIWNAAKADGTPPDPDRAGVPVAWLIWRRGLRSYFRSLAPDEALALDAARAGRTFGEICEGLCEWTTPEETPAYAASMLKRWIEDEIVTGVEV